MSAHSDDFSMMDDLRDLSQAYRDATKYEDDGEPSPALDAAILAAAHRAVASRPQAVPARQPSRFVRWRIPLSMAASFLVGVLIVVLFVSQESGPQPDLLAQAPQMPQPMSEQPPPPQPLQVSPRLQAEMNARAEPKPLAPAVMPENREDKTIVQRQAPRRQAPRSLAESASRFEDLASVAGMPEPDSQSDTRARHSAIAQAERLPTAPEPDDAAAVSEPIQFAAEADAPAPVRESSDQFSEPLVIAQAERQAESLPAAPEPAQVATVSKPVQPAAAPAPKRAARVSEPSAAMMEERAVEADQPVPVAEITQVAPMESKAADMERMQAARSMPATQEEPIKQPQVWLEEIEKLRRDGKIKEARKSLTEFRKRYPNHELPKTLRDL